MNIEFDLTDVCDILLHYEVCVGCVAFLRKFDINFDNVKCSDF